MKVYQDIPYTKTGHPSQVLDLWLPEAESFPVFIYFHGGGLEAGTKDASACAEDYTKNGVALVSAEYRMYPEAVYPEFLRDAAAAVAWVKNHIGEYGECKGIFVGGSSAGGYITQMLCFDPKYLTPYGIDPDSLAGYVMDAGQPTTHYNVMRERGLDPRRVVIDAAAPIYHIAGGRDYAPMEILVSEKDIPNRLEQTQLLLGTMRHFGCNMDKVTYKYMAGCSHCNYRDENGRYLLPDIVCEFIGKTLG